MLFLTWTRQHQTGTNCLHYKHRLHHRWCDLRGKCLPLLMIKTVIRIIWFVASFRIHQPFSRIFHTRRSLAHPEELKESRQSIRAAMGRLPLRIRRYRPANPIICDNQTMDYRYVHLSRPYRSAPLGISVVKSEEGKLTFVLMLRLRPPFCLRCVLFLVLGFVTCRLNEELAVLPSTFHPTIGEIITEVDGQDCRGWSKEDLLKHVKGRLSILIRLKIVSD